MNRPLLLSITQEEILEDLFHRGTPPGRWRIPPTAHIDAVLRTIEESSPTRA